MNPISDSSRRRSSSVFGNPPWYARVYTTRCSKRSSATTLLNCVSYSAR